DVEVHLLRHLLARPLRRLVVLDRLERDALTVVGADFVPPLVAVDLPVEHCDVEVGEGACVRTVDDDARETCDSHAANSMASSGRSTSGLITGVDATRQLL